MVQIADEESISKNLRKSKTSSVDIDLTGLAIEFLTTEGEKLAEVKIF